MLIFIVSLGNDQVHPWQKLLALPTFSVAAVFYIGLIATVLAVVIAGLSLSMLARKASWWVAITAHFGAGRLLPGYSDCIDPR